MKKILYIITILILASSCEDVINPELIDAEPVLVVDAWVNNKNEAQNIYLTRTQPYFENVFPEKVDNATVYIEDNEGNRFDFTENDSAYTWQPVNGEVLGVTGRQYLLTVEIDGEVFVSATQMGRSPEIDSIKFSYEEADDFIQTDYYIGEFVARDFEGAGDTYWIQASKNGQFLSKPNEINVAYDAGFSRGGNVDGIVFIQPIQNAVNPFDEDPDNNNQFLPPYLVNDELYVEIISISEPAFFFLNEVIIQTDRAGGFGALFAQPLANVSTNIFPADESSDTEVLGFFNVGAVTSRRQVLTPEIAEAAQREATEE